MTSLSKTSGRAAGPLTPNKAAGASGLAVVRRVECLDGLRGLAALWVLTGHALILTGWHLPVLSQPDLGVDLFIMLSGFLMVFQYQLRSATEDWSKPATWAAFWFRRYFRIAPLFYVMLVFALAAGGYVFACRATIDAFLHAEPQLASRYVDHGLVNIVMHLSFLFGLFPTYAFKTALPDWSLGLEMQFYAAFPFFVLIARKIGWLATAVVIGVVTVVVDLALRKLHVSYPMPSLLPLKLHIFLCGMLLAAALGATRTKSLTYLGLAIFLAALPFGGGNSIMHLLVREAIVLVFFSLTHIRGGGLAQVATIMGKGLFHWMGELSYGVYLVHLLFLQPIAAALISHFGAGISAPERFGMAMAITIPLAYGMAFLTYKLVEIPGQSLGKATIKRIFHSRAKASSAVPETIAAP
jgi:peptidoglycan/LPS O-acetylase OafA/YrhL